MINRVMTRYLAAFLLVFMAHSAWAIDIHSAKDQGLVGEANTGYIAAVKTPASAEVQQLIRSVNAGRKAEFESAAARTGATLEQVRARFYQLAVNKSSPGHYYQDARGSWQRK